MQNLFWLRCILVYWAESTVGVEFGISASFAMDSSLWGCWVSGERSSLLFDSEGLVPKNLMLQCSGWIWLLRPSPWLKICCFTSVSGALYLEDYFLHISDIREITSSPCDPVASFYWRLIGWTTAQSLHLLAAPLTFPPLVFCLFLSLSPSHTYTQINSKESNSISVSSLISSMEPSRTPTCEWVAHTSTSAHQVLLESEFLFYPHLKSHSWCK